MRKLSKKISMLMVLAMLVSLFSGIVSASAASAWSFKSSKYDVEVGETIEMEKNEYADFDLFKNDAAPAGYTVKWESSNPDAVWVNAKTGQLRADKFDKADLGDKATISATFTNTATKKSATRSFVIVVAEKSEYEITVNFGDEVLAVGQKYDLAAVVKADGKEVKADVAFAIDGKTIDAAYTPAAEGEYTIVTTATIDGKVVATAKTVVVVAKAGLVSAKQLSFNSVALTFDSAAAAKAVVADITKLGSVYLIGENEIQSFINTAKVDEKNPAVVNVTLYNDIVKGVTYKFTYADKTASIVGVDTNVFTSMTIKTTSVPAESWEDVEVNLYNADGVLVKTVDYGFTLEAILDGAYAVNGSQIYFHDKNTNAVASVKATYWMGYDDNGNKIADLTAVGTIASYNADATSISNIKAWSTEGTASYQWSTNNSVNVVIGENKQLYFKVDKFDRTGKWVGEPAFTGAASTFEGGSLRFVSSNENVVLVDNTLVPGFGTFYPVGVGTSQIVVYRYFNNDFDGTKQVMGVFNVNVAAYRTLTAVNPTVTSRKVSTSADSYTLLIPNAVDQLGKAMDGTTQYFLKLENNPKNVEVYVDGNQIYYTPNSEGVEFAINAGTAESGWGEFFKVTVVVTNANDYTNSAQIGLTVKHANDYKSMYKVVPINVGVPNGSWSYRYNLNDVKSSIDMNLGADRWNDDMSRFATEIKMNIVDNNGYLVQIIDEELSYGSATTGNYFWVVKKNGQDASADFNGRTLVAVADNGATLDKVLNTGTYSVVIYKNNNGEDQYIISKNIVITDSTPKVTAVKVNNKVAGTSEAILIDTMLGKNLTFVRNGQAIDENDVEIVDVEAEVIVNTNRVSVKKVWISQSYGAGALVEEVSVYTTFEYNN